MKLKVSNENDQASDWDYLLYTRLSKVETKNDYI